MNELNKGKLNTVTTRKEQVAYVLAEKIFHKERVVKFKNGNGFPSRIRKEKSVAEFRQYYLDLYAECLNATSDRRTIGKINPP